MVILWSTFDNDCLKFVVVDDVVPFKLRPHCRLNSMVVVINDSTQLLTYGNVKI
jgi:hypothetical protein